MKPFRFCPSCGTEVGAPNADGAFACPSCGRRWYRNPAPTVAAAIVRAGKVLIAVRARHPEKGRIDIPGGFLHVGEELLDGLRREMREELGVEIAVSHDDYVQAAAHTYGDEGDWLLSLGFRARLASGEPSPSDDVAEVAWVGPEEIDGLDWAWPHDAELARLALQRD
jgi:NADH pyrophosphatase NudC (nudix superfamily)